MTNPRPTLRPLHYGVVALVFGILVLSVLFLTNGPSVPRFQEVLVSTQKPISYKACLLSADEASHSHQQQAKNIDLVFEEILQHQTTVTLPILLLGFASIATGLSILTKLKCEPLLLKSILRSAFVGLILGFLTFAFFQTFAKTYRDVARTTTSIRGNSVNHEKKQFCETHFK